jgi:hypothetical protein
LKNIALLEGHAILERTCLGMAETTIINDDI